MINLIAIGTGSAFTVDNFQTNYLLEIGGYNLLIDCGGDVRRALQHCGRAAKDINGVYISHLHADHVGGLEWLGFSTYFNPQVPKPDLYISNSLVGRLWSECLSGGMGSIQRKLLRLDDYFDVHSIPSKDGKFRIVHNGAMASFQLVQTVHVMNGYYLVPSFGLMVDTVLQKTLITTDTQLCHERLNDFYAESGLIIHDCETSAFPSGVHAHYTLLSLLPESVKGKMWLTHYQDGSENLHDAVGDGFLGFLPRLGRVPMPSP